MPILPFRGIWPTIADDAFIADSAYVIGDVTIGAGSSVWYGAVVRGDMAPIRIGERTNIQDGSVVHVDTDVPTVIGDDVVIGHGAIVHGATVGNGCMIAMRATVMNRSVIGDGAIIGAGAILTQDKTVPARMLAIGIPAKVGREVSDAEHEAVAANAARYVAYGAEHRDEHDSRFSDSPGGAV
jgi:carbonic anhydrase/acetyltransferase-like protein (isoleucine patch superfamily)